MILTCFTKFASYFLSRDVEAAHQEFPLPLSRPPSPGSSLEGCLSIPFSPQAYATHQSNSTHLLMIRSIISPLNDHKEHSAAQRELVSLITASAESSWNKCR